MLPLSRPKRPRVTADHPDGFRPSSPLARVGRTIATSILNRGRGRARCESPNLFFREVPPRRPLAPQSPIAMNIQRPLTSSRKTARPRRAWVWLLRSALPPAQGLERGDVRAWPRASQSTARSEALRTCGPHCCSVAASNRGDNPDFGAAPAPMQVMTTCGGDAADA
jgi:hypothetical protein